MSLYGSSPTSLMTPGLLLVTPPAAEPVTLAAAKAHLRVDFSADDALIGTLISAAREMCEAMLRRAIYQQTWLMTQDQFYTLYNYGAYSTIIQLPRPKLIGITSIQYTDQSGTSQTLAPSLYVVDATTEPARLMPADGNSWPTPNIYTPGAVRITFQCGSYGDGVAVDTCPAAIKQAILLLVGHLYANREATSDKPLSTIPLAVDALLSPYKFHGAGALC